MNQVFDNEQRYRPQIEKLAEALETPWPRIADWRVIPLQLVLELADFYSIDLPKGTAEDRLRYLIDEAGLVDPNGAAIEFRDYESSKVAMKLAEAIEEVKRKKSRFAKYRKPATLTDRSFRERYAGSKFEAVNKISLLTQSGPETLGPGSKERKSVLINLHKGLGFGNAPELPKTELAERIAQRLGVEWDSSCYSTGETITREGLNRLLAGASEVLNPGRAELSARDEAVMYSAEIMQQVFNQPQNSVGPVSAIWDGRHAVQEMLDAGFAHARQTEWPGWYFEFKTLTSLVRRFGGGPYRVGATTFDYRNIRTWDLKSHANTTNQAPLNDRIAIREAVEKDGLGFIVLSGIPLFDGEREFYDWHMQHVRGKTSHKRSDKSRRLKTGFELERLDFFFIKDMLDVTRLEQRKILTAFNQGRQQGGAPRKIKYNLDCLAAKTDSVWVYSLEVSDYVNRVNEETSA